VNLFYFTNLILFLQKSNISPQLLLQMNENILFFVLLNI